MDSTLNSVTSVPCTCGTLERLARDERYGVVFDDVAGEYQLESVDGRWRHQMYHCLWCGGCLPSKSDTLWTEPDAAEKAEVKDLLSGAKSLPDVLHALGTPDRSTDCVGLDTPDVYASQVVSGKRQRTVHQYFARWTTLDLHVIEYDDGSTSYAISGKFKGAPPSSRGMRSWWPPWKRH